MADFQPGKTAVLAKGYLGDAVMAIPMLRALMAAGRCVEVITSGAAVPLLERAGASVRVVPEEKPARDKAVLEALRTGGYEEAILLNRSFRSAFFAWRAKVPVRLGHAVEWRKPLLTASCPYPASRYEADCCMDLARLSGISGARPDLFLNSVRPSSASNGPIVVHAGARYESKQIPAAVLAEALNSLAKGGRQVVLVGGFSETEQNRRLKASLKTNAADLVGKTDFGELADVLELAALVIGSDTGVTHLAVSLRAPAVMVFGPNSADKWGHPLDRAASVRAPDGTMKSVDASQIIEAAERLLSRDEAETRMVCRLNREP